MKSIHFLASTLLLILSNSPLVSSLRKLHEDLTSIHFIGDLHADAECAKQWVEKTNLVNLTSTPYEWLGNPETDALVFLGDYVDKGSASASVLKFVRELQETFPDNVVTILGNHDFFLVLDSALSFSEANPHPLRHPFYDYAYSFMHPEEYIESTWTPDRDDDEELLGEILSALSYIYDRNLQGDLHMCAPHCEKDQVDLFEKVPPFKQNLTLRERAVDRLDTWRKEYAQGLFDSGLLSWMTRQPIVAIVGDALIVHGGVSEHVANYLHQVAQKSSISVVDAVHYSTNVIFRKFFQEELLKVDGANKIETRLPQEGYPNELILDMVQHRGYFKQGTGCNEVNFVLDTIGAGLNRIVVGHTPHDYALELCGGKLLASDSSLSRSFRAHGNLYCPLRDSLDEYRGKGSCGRPHEQFCEGSISVLKRESKDDPWPTNVERFKFHELVVKDLPPISGEETVVDQTSIHGQTSDEL
jgi:hypothetical protein